MIRADRVTFSFIAITMVTVACVTTEPVNFSRDVADASADASTDSSVSPPPSEASTDGGTCSLSVNPDVRMCLPLGGACVADGDCCTQVCRMGTCLMGASCFGPGVNCRTRSDCCSGRCEPSGNARGQGLVCTAYCSPDMSPCTDAHACCSLACNGGVCGGPICLKIGDQCTNDSQCCFGQCDMRHIPRVCDAPLRTQPCRPTGEACGADAGAPCCSKVCDPQTGRCDWARERVESRRRRA